MISRKVAYVLRKFRLIFAYVLGKRSIFGCVTRKAPMPRWISCGNINLPFYYVGMLDKVLEKYCWSSYSGTASVKAMEKRINKDFFSNFVRWIAS